MNRNKGIILVAISAILFGITPVISKITYSQGSNSIMVGFLRSLLSMPFLYGIVKYQKENIKISKNEAVKIIILGFFGTAATNMTLYLSYNFISVGTATTIHFTYPALVMLISVFFLGRKLDKFKFLSLAISIVGVAMFLEKGKTGAITGVILALTSAGTYAFYIIYMDKSGLKNMYTYKLSFYLGAVTATSMLIIGTFTNKITFAITPMGWVNSLLIAFLASVIAISFFQIGVRNVGAVGASMFSMLEPVSSIILGYIFLNETMSMQKIIGCVLIFISLIIYAKTDK